jgi:hypothetical protein
VFLEALKVLTIIRPESLVRWHRAFSQLLAWKSLSLGGRPQIEAGLRALIRQMSMENPRQLVHSTANTCSFLRRSFGLSNCVSAL